MTTGTTVRFNGAGSSYITSAPALVFNNVEFAKTSNSADINLSTTTMNILGNLTINNIAANNKVNNGTIDLTGNLILQDGDGGGANIRMISASPQSITSAGGWAPSIEIASSSTVTFTGSIDISKAPL